MDFLPLRSFVHSYEFCPTNKVDLVANYQYFENHIVAAVRNENITGVQFHPEKSGKEGLRILANFSQS